MRIPPEMLVDGCVRTLLEQVLPEVTSRHARGQLFAVVDVLRNLRDRVEHRGALVAAETESARAALDRAILALRASGAAAEADAIAGKCAEIARTSAGTPGDVDAVLIDSLRIVASLPDAVGGTAHAALGGHIAAQSIRELAVLKPSMLEEISRGESAC